MITIAITPKSQKTLYIKELELSKSLRICENNRRLLSKKSDAEINSESEISAKWEIVEDEKGVSEIRIVHPEVIYFYLLRIKI